jgi:hypothetical protein
MPIFVHIGGQIVRHVEALFELVAEEKPHHALAVHL